MQSKWKVTSNLQHTCGVVKIFHGKQFDANTRYIEATIMDGDSAFTMPSNPKFMVGIRQADGTEMVYDAIITATPTLGLVVTVDTATYMSHGAINSTFTFDGTNWKRSGTVVDLSAWGITIVSGTPSNGNTIVIATTSAVTYSSNVVTFAVHPNLFLTAGDGCAELYICDGDEIISTFVYTVRVEKAAANPNNAVASTSFAVITAQIESYVNAWLTAHPEATTTVQDGSITEAKLAAALKAKLLRTISVTDTSTTIASIASQLNTINANSEHVLFDVSALGAQMYLCTIFINGSNYKILDLVNGRLAEGTFDNTSLLTMAIAQASDLATQAQIDALQGEIDELGGKTILENWDALGDLILSGNSESVISPGDKTNFHWLTSAIGTTSHGLTVSCSNLHTFANGVGEAEAKDYLFVYDGTNWTLDGETVDLTDFALTVTGTPSTGEVMDVKTTIKSVSYTFTSYDTVEAADADVPHNWCVEQTYAPDTRVFDYYESLFCVQANKSIPAGKYYIPMRSYRSGKTFNACFTLSAALGSTAKIQAARAASSSMSAPDATGSTISGAYLVTSVQPKVYGETTNAGSAIAVTYLSDADAASGGYTNLNTLNTSGNTVFVVGNLDTAALGNNGWAFANLRQYLNDDSKDGSYTPTHDNDVAAAYNRQSGFLYALDPRVRRLIQAANVKCVAGYGNTDVYAQGQTYTVQDDVFLLSMKEMAFDLQTTEGEMTDLYGLYTDGVLTNNAVVARAKYNKSGGTLNSYRWSRSAYSTYANSARNVAASGASNNYNAGGAYYVAPAFIVGKKSANQ